MRSSSEDFPFVFLKLLLPLDLSSVCSVARTLYAKPFTLAMWLTVPILVEFRRTGWALIAFSLFCLNVDHELIIKTVVYFQTTGLSLEKILWLELYFSHKIIQYYFISSDSMALQLSVSLFIKPKFLVEMFLYWVSVPFLLLLLLRYDKTPGICFLENILVGTDSRPNERTDID